MVSFTTHPTPWDITTQAASLLGGANALGMKPRNSLDWVYLIRKRFPTLALDAFGGMSPKAVTETRVSDPAGNFV